MQAERTGSRRHASDGVRLGPPVIAVSLKMYFDPRRTHEWCRQLADLAGHHPAVRDGLVSLVVLPAVTALTAAVDLFRGTKVEVGAQDLFYEDRGPFTGGISGADLRQLGCSYAEVGHIERRRVFGESDRVVNLKTHAAWRNGLTPLLCVGERERTSTVLAAQECVRQLESAVEGLDTRVGCRSLVVAYEPAWAIGGTAPATSAHVSAVTHELRSRLRAHHLLMEASIIYGGSAREGLLTDLGGAVDGLFLGRYAHDASAVAAVLDEMLVRR